MQKQKVCLGITNPKSPQNMGSIMRAAGCYGAERVMYSGKRFGLARRFATDTKDMSSQIPLIETDNLLADVPQGARIVAVELVEGATPLPAFEHPENAFYLFGPEDGTIDQTTLDQCHDTVYIPTNGCMNLAATVNVLLYDRMAKSAFTTYGDKVIRASRDTNNRTMANKQ